jgi:hypothetical protein
MSALGDPTAAANIALYNKNKQFNSKPYSCFARKPCSTTSLPEWYQLTQAIVNFLFQNRSTSFTAEEIHENIEANIMDTTISFEEVKRLLTNSTKTGLLLANYQGPTSSIILYSYNPRSALVNPNNWAFVWNYNIQGFSGGPQPAYIFTSGDRDFQLRSMPKGTSPDVKGSYTTSCKIIREYFEDLLDEIPKEERSCSQRDSTSKEKQQTLIQEEKKQGCAPNQPRVINNGYVQTSGTASLVAGTWQ